MTELIKSPTPIRTFELNVFVSGFLEGELKDWPANIQDKIYAAVEKLSQEHMLPLAIVHSRCDISHTDDGNPSTPFINVVVSEIVARDERFTDEASIRRAFNELTHTSALNGGKYH